MKGHQASYRIQDKEFQVQYLWNPRMKRMRMRFDSKENVLKISAPRGTAYNDMRDFIKESESWILKNITPCENSLFFKSGTLFPLFGQETTLIHQEYPHSDKIQLVGTTFQVKGPESHLNERVCSYLRGYAKSEFTKRCEDYAAQIGKNVTRVTIRDPKSRWGSCSEKGNISLSWRLIFAPLDVSNYVCAHEVAHLQEMNHSRAFWAIVGDLHPAPQEARSWLKKNGATLFRYGS